MADALGSLGGAGTQYAGGAQNVGHRRELDPFLMRFGLEQSQERAQIAERFNQLYQGQQQQSFQALGQLGGQALGQIPAVGNAVGDVAGAVASPIRAAAEPLLGPIKRGAQGALSAVGDAFATEATSQATGQVASQAGQQVGQQAATQVGGNLITEGLGAVIPLVGAGYQAYGLYKNLRDKSFAQSLHSLDRLPPEVQRAIQGDLREAAGAEAEIGFYSGALSGAGVGTAVGAGSPIGTVAGAAIGGALGASPGIKKEQAVLRDQGLSRTERATETLKFHSPTSGADHIRAFKKRRRNERLAHRWRTSYYSTIRHHSTA